jgi:hypothetical protein
VGGRDGSSVPGSCARGPARQVLVIYSPAVAGIELKSLRLVHAALFTLHISHYRDNTVLSLMSATALTSLLMNAASRLTLAALQSAHLTAPVTSSLGNARLKLEDHWLRTTMGEEKLWYGAASGKPGVVLGTWASQRQHQVRGSPSDDDDRPMAALRKLGFPKQGPAVPLSGLQQRQFLQEQEQPACSDKCRADYESGHFLPLRPFVFARLARVCYNMLTYFTAQAEKYNMM